MTRAAEDLWSSRFARRFCTRDVQNTYRGSDAYAKAEALRRSVELAKLLISEVKNEGSHIIIEDRNGNKKELLIGGLYHIK